MNIFFNDPDEEGFEISNFEKTKTKRQKLNDRRTVHQLAAQEAEEADPEAGFKHPGLNELANTDHLDELIRVIKTGKEASVYLGRNSQGLVAVKVYTDMRVRSFKHDEAAVLREVRAGR